MNSSSLYHPKFIMEDYHLKVVAYYFKEWNNFSMPFHTHSAIEIMYVISGVCLVEMKDQSFPMKKGDLILIDAHIPHRLIVDEHTSCRMLNVEFIFTPKQGTFPSLKQLADENQALRTMLSMKLPHTVLSDPNEIYHTLKSLVLELDEQEPDNQLLIHLLHAQLLIRIAKLTVEAAEKEPQQGGIYVKNVIAYMHHHYDCDIQIKDLAAVVNLHPSYLHRIFKAQLGCSMIEYLTSLRMEKAKMLLTQTDIPVLEISDYVGVGSRQYFHALFKKYTTHTPAEFRKSVEKHQWNYPEQVRILDIPSLKQSEI